MKNSIAILYKGVPLTVEFEYETKAECPYDRQQYWEAYPLERYTITAIYSIGDISELLPDSTITELLQLLEANRGEV